MSRPSRLLISRAIRCVALTAAATACGASLCVAQEVAQKARVARQVAVEQAPVPQKLGGLNVDSLTGSEPTDGVFVRDSQAAVDKLALAQKMERLKEWNKSADLYQEVLEKFRDRVVPSGSDRDKKINQYTSITRPVQEQLAKWPQEGLDVYRARYETPAATLLDGATPGDVDTLNSVYDRYFVTDAGKLAGIRLIDLYMERGEYRAAATVGDRLLDWHPNLLAERAPVLYRTALAYHLAGDDTVSGARLATLKKNHAADRGVVRGKDVLLADSLREEMVSPVSRDQMIATDSWPMFGGSPDRARISPAEGRPGARLFSIPFSKPVWPNTPAQQRQAYEQQLNRTTAAGGTLGVMPVADRGELFFQDGQRVFAVSLESGLPLPGWAQTYGGSGQYTLANYWGSPRARQLTVTLTEKAVLAVMGQPDRQAMMQGMPLQGEARLVSLDRQSGKENWSVMLSQLPEEASGQRTLQLTGSPLVVGENVLIIGRAGKQAQFEDCYVLSFDLNTGKYRWSCYIASANTGGAMFGMQPMLVSENTSHLAYANGRVYVQTNLGALACLDAYSGTIVWLDIYPTRNAAFAGNPGFVPFPQSMQNQQNTRKPWAYNPVIIADGRVFTLPTEGKNLLIYDAATGAEIRRISSEHLLECDTLLGVVGDNLIATGDKSIVCLNWKTYDFEKFDTDNDYIWKQVLPMAIRGRGFLTTDSVFVPAEDRVFRLDMGNGKVVGVYPPMARVWDEAEGPGNVLVTADHVIIAAANSVDVYTDLTVARAKLDKEVAAAPGDVQARLKYAEIMFVAGEPDLAVQKLDDAIGLIGGIGQLQQGVNRDRIFRDALAFAVKTSADDRAESKARTAQLFDRASAAAAQPMQQVQYRLTRARYAEAARDGAGAARLYQEILSDPQMRPTPLVDEATGAPTQADAVAERAIARLIKENPGVYEPFQKAAAASLEEARGAKDDVSAKLLAVAQAYPNSTVSTQAMLDAADSYEAAGNPNRAVQVLRQLYFKDPESPQKAHILESMARNYLAMPNRVDVAAARLAQGASLPADPRLQKPLRLPDGRILQDVTFSKALDEVRKYSGRQAARTLPDFKIPIPQPRQPGSKNKRQPAFLPDSPQSVIADVHMLVVPIREASRADRVVAWTSAGKITVYVAGKSGNAGTGGAVVEEPKACAWLGGNLLVWGATQVNMLGGDATAALWSLDLKQMPSLQVAHADAPPQNVPPNNVFVNGNGQVFIRGNQQRMIFRNVNGGMVAQQAPNPPPVPKVVAGAGEQIVEVHPVGDRVLIATTTGRLLSVDLTNGKVAWQNRLTERPIDRLVATEDFAVVKISDETSVRLVALDTFSGQIRGSKTFIAQNGMVPVNLALSADGTLVYTLPDRLCLKNLYTAWPDTTDREVTGPPGLPPFTGANLPDQLVIAEGRILALADNGSEKYVRVHSLETGNPVPLKFVSQQGNEEVDRVLNAGKSWSATLRVVGSQLYVVGPDGIFSYNIDRPSETWSTRDDTHFNVKDVFVGQQFLVIVDDETPPPNGGAAAQPAFTLRTFGRYPGTANSTAESGRRDYEVHVSDPGVITGSWQAADGGFYYVTADQKLHMLLGSKAD